MEEKKTLGINGKRPIENHETAAWADIETTTEIANVPIPREASVASARKWVDANEK